MDQDVFNMIITAIGSVGFPIVVAVWLLWRSDRREERTQELIMEVRKAIEVLTATLGR